VIRVERSANATTLRLSRRTKVTLWRRMRAAGWRHELSPHGDGGWTRSYSWGRPRVHSRLAFLVCVEHRPAHRPNGVNR
jgi:hypothetical protein